MVAGLAMVFVDRHGGCCSSALTFRHFTGILEWLRTIVNAGWIQLTRGLSQMLSRLARRVRRWPVLFARYRAKRFGSLMLMRTRELGLPTLILMENAGRGAAAWLAEFAAGFSSQDRSHGHSPKSRGRVLNRRRFLLPQVLILCGPGNNGGDGGVVARHLNAWGFPVRICWFVSRDQLRGDPQTQWRILERSGSGSDGVV